MFPAHLSLGCNYAEFLRVNVLTSQQEGTQYRVIPKKYNRKPRQIQKNTTGNPGKSKKIRLETQVIPKNSRQGVYLSLYQDCRPNLQKLAKFHLFPSKDIKAKKKLRNLVASQPITIVNCLHTSQETNNVQELHATFC
jgi:hypothetical protein